VQIPEERTPSQQIGQRVRAERRRSGFDQQTLAMVANVAVRSVHRVEKGEPTVRLDVLTRILAALGFAPGGARTRRTLPAR
jgi:y4mF family transcriptional regulator